MNGPFSDWRILICDDSPVERMALSHFLRGEGYHVDEASDGDSAIEHLKAREVNAVLLDLHMPDVNGFDVLNYLHEHRRGLPVILLSGMPLDEIQHNMHGLKERELPPLLIKPINPDQVLQLLELQLGDNLPPLPGPADGFRGIADI